MKKNFRCTGPKSSGFALWGYDSFADFKSQMEEVLKNAESWKFSLV